MASTNIGVFRKLLRRAIFINSSESELFDKIPDAVFEGIFEHNFNGNLKLAERVLLNRHKEVDRVDRARLEQAKQSITNLGKASARILRSLKAGEPVLFVTDADNDGSLAQSILIEFSKTLPHDLAKLIHVEYAQPLSHVHGLTREVVDLSFDGRGWDHGDKVLIVTADNGINNQTEVERIQAGYRNVDIIITDHHLPREDLVVRESNRVTIFNPKYKPTEYFKKKNISGANTLGVLLKSVHAQLLADPDMDLGGIEDYTIALSNIDEIGSWANLLDYANADIADMPIRPYIVEKALGLRPLLNVSNSMRNLVTGNFSDQDFEEIELAARGTGAGKEVTAQWLREKVDNVRMLNITAQKLLNIYAGYASTPTARSLALSKQDFYTAMADEMSHVGNIYESINPNFIEQLRPVIFNVAAIDNKNIFLATLADTMVQVFDDLRGIERDIQEGLRGVGLLKSEKRANSTILYPVDSSVTKVFNRKLLSKAYNEDNNGFLLILNDVTDMEARGSMRSMYPITKLLEDKSEIEDQLGITVNFQGHEMAAGFFINSTDGRKLTEQRMADFNAWMDDRVGELKVAERSNQLPTLEVDFVSIGLIDKINRAVKANLAGMWGVPAIITFSPDKRHGVWITDNQTAEQLSLDELLERKHFGYQAVQTDFHDGAVVMPIESLRTLSDSNFTKSLRLSYLDENVFMASQVVDREHLPRLMDLKGGRQDQKDLIDYYKETYRNSNFVDVSREDIKSSPYFRYNRYGSGEFDFFESLLIEMLDQSNADVLAVIDTEGTGLGKAPKCFNIGGTNISVEPGSGTRMPSGEFEDRYFRNATGNEFLLTPEQRIGIERLGDDEEVPEGSLVLHNISVESGVDYQERFAFHGKAADLLRVTNVKSLANDEVVFNRRIHGTGFSFLINNDDFAITQEFENLTGIGNWMVDEVGIPAHQVDKEMVSFYSNLKTEEGKPAKIIFQAHNMPYDRGVILANFQKFHLMMDEHLTSDTAKIARAAKLAYDDTPVASFDVPGFPKAYFYNSPYSEYSMGTFLARTLQGKGGVFPDTKAKILLRYNADNQRFSIIDRNANREFMIEATPEKLIEHMTVGQAPNTELKYSVERLSLRAMIRNILLLDKQAPARVELADNEEPFKSALELFQDKYHFDITPEKNINHFVQSLQHTEQNRKMMDEVNLTHLTSRFLEANKETQARFHDGWIYEKVLSIHEPDANSLRVPAEVIEEVNYFTDLPSSKIRRVFDDVIRFKRHFNLDHALVHEQHNNIRQRSEDGQGLADTVYEAVLPQFLAMMKFFNPYYHSVKPAAKELVETNIRGSMIQTLMADDYTNDIAADSFSMTQMLAFDRKGKTDLIKKAEALAVGSQGAVPQKIKFKLGTDILPTNSGLYATPMGHVDREQIKKDSEMLTFILVNEQIKSSTGDEGLLKIAQANDEKSIAFRDDLLTRYSQIDFSRRDTRLKRLQEVVRDAYDENYAKLPPSLKIDQDLHDCGLRMIADFGKIYAHTGGGGFHMKVEQLREDIKLDLERNTTANNTKDPPDFGKETVRNENFLPNFDARRQEPMKFALKHMGVNYCAPFMKTIQEAEAAEESTQVQVKLPTP